MASATAPLSVTLNGVTGKIMWESFRKGRRLDGPYEVIEYLVPYGGSDLFIDGIMGGVSGSGSSIRYLPRQQCPTNTTLYATAAEGEYVGEVYPNNATTDTIFQFVKVRAEYGVLTWPQLFTDDPGGQQSFPNDNMPGEPILFADCEIDTAGQLVTMPTGSYTFQTAPQLPANIPATKWEAISTWRITRHNYPNLPYSKVASLHNKVNSTTFLGQDVAKVRFANSRTVLQMTSDGTRVQRFEMIFEVKFESTWNQFLRPDDLKYDNVLGFVTSQPPYTLADLRPLLS